MRNFSSWKSMKLNENKLKITQNNSVVFAAKLKHAMTYPKSKIIHTCCFVTWGNRLCAITEWLWQTSSFQLKVATERLRFYVFIGCLSCPNIRILRLVKSWILLNIVLDYLEHEFCLQKSPAHFEGFNRTKNTRRKRIWCCSLKTFSLFFFSPDRFEQIKILWK